MATRKRSKNTALIRVINDEYQEMLRSREHPTHHLFFDNYIWWKKYYADSVGDRFPVSVKIKEPMDLTGIAPKDDCKFVPAKTLSKEDIVGLYSMLTDPAIRKFDPLRKRLIEFTEYAMPATRTSTKGWKEYKGPRDLNVMILGAGPVGLFTALYLNETYNKLVDTTTRKVNILLVDNRIEREGFKSPYSRSTQFGFNIDDLQVVLKNIFCWTMQNHGGGGYKRFDYIHILENLLYTVAFRDDIPMLFTKQFEDLDTVKAFIKREKVHVLFDCTGGRIKKNVVYNIPWTSYSFKKGTEEIKYNPETGYYEFQEKGVKTSKPTLRLQLLDNHHKEIMTGNVFAFPTKAADLELIGTYKNACYSVEDYLKIASHFEDANLQQFFPAITQGVRRGSIHSVKMITFDSTARHSPFAAAPLSKECIYIRVGDSLGSTEYGIKFGMKHSIRFSKYICNMMSAFL